jgi:hypothetical protein
MTNVKAKVWATRRRGGYTWHYAIVSGKDTVVLYDNTGAWEPILCNALIRVKALRHMVIAGHKLEPYTGSMAPIETSR